MDIWFILLLRNEDSHVSRGEDGQIRQQIIISYLSHLIFFHIFHISKSNMIVTFYYEFFYALFVSAWTIRPDVLSIDIILKFSNSW